MKINTLFSISIIMNVAFMGLIRQQEKNVRLLPHLESKKGVVSTLFGYLKTGIDELRSIGDWRSKSYDDIIYLIKTQKAGQEIDET